MKNYANKLDSIYRNSKRMPIFSILSYFFPILVPISMGLGLVYYFQRKSLIKSIEHGDIKLNELPELSSNKDLTNSFKFEYVKLHKLALLSPFIIFLFIVTLVLTIFIALHMTK